MIWRIRRESASLPLSPSPTGQPSVRSNRCGPTRDSGRPDPGSADRSARGPPSHPGRGTSEPAVGIAAVRHPRPGRAGGEESRRRLRISTDDRGLAGRFGSDVRRVYRTIVGIRQVSLPRLFPFRGPVHRRRWHAEPIRGHGSGRPPRGLRRGLPVRRRRSPCRGDAGRSRCPSGRRSPRGWSLKARGLR